MKTTVQFEFTSVEAAIEAMARMRGVGEVVAKEIAAPPKSEKSPKAAATPPTAAPSAPASASSAPATPTPPAAQPPTAAPTPPDALAPPLKTLADLVGRGANENRQGTVDVLKKYGAQKASQVAEDKRAACVAELEALLSGGDLTS